MRGKCLLSLFIQSHLDFKVYKMFWTRAVYLCLGQV